MDIKQLRASGFLELYLIGECTPEEKTIVEQALSQYPELQNDIEEISKSLFAFAAAHGNSPSLEVKDELMGKIDSSQSIVSTPKTTKTNPPNTKYRSLARWMSAAASILAIFSIYQWQESRSLQSELLMTNMHCDSIQQSTNQQFALFEKIRDTNSKWIDINPADNYENVQVAFIHNATSQNNFIQIQNLPLINDDLSFQLWSLIPGQDPIPLDVFQGDEGLFIPVEFVSDTPTYAITIEPFGGRDTPTLERLIGTFTIT